MCIENAFEIQFSNNNNNENSISYRFLLTSHDITYRAISLRRAKNASNTPYIEAMSCVESMFGYIKFRSVYENLSTAKKSKRRRRTKTIQSWSVWSELCDVHNNSNKTLTSFERAQCGVQKVDMRLRVYVCVLYKLSLNACTKKTKNSVCAHWVSEWYGRNMMTT